MNLIIDRLGDSVKPFAEGLLQLLPEVWQDAEGQSLLRIQVRSLPMLQLNIMLSFTDFNITLSFCVHSSQHPFVKCNGTTCGLVMPCIAACDVAVLYCSQCSAISF